MGVPGKLSFHDVLIYLSVWLLQVHPGSYKKMYTVC